MPDLDDELMLKCKDGDKDAFSLIVNKYRTPLINFIARMGVDRETAEDLAQETFIRMYRAVPRYKVEAAKFTTWMYKIAVRLCQNELRNRRRRGRYMLKATIAGGEGDDDVHDIVANAPAHVSYRPDYQLQKKELYATVQNAIATLSEKYRVPLVLRDIQEMNYNEISKIMSIPVGTVKSRINRARLMLKDKLKKYMEGGNIDELQKG